MNAVGAIALERDGGAALTKRIGGLVAIAIAIGLGVMTPSWGVFAGLGAAALAIMGLSLLAMSFQFTGKGACPSCGKEMNDLPGEAEAVVCPHCAQFATIEGRTMRVTPEDMVARHPVFPITVEPGTQPAFAHECVGCAKPATVTRKWPLTKTVVGVPGVGRVVKNWEIDVPLCDEHGRLQSSGLPTGIVSFGGNISIGSFRVWRAVRGR